jgi:NifB/MoaA-like Fe-S oxidoreductase
MKDMAVVLCPSLNQRCDIRRTKRIVEEVIDGKIVLSMRALYQSKVGLTLINTGMLDRIILVRLMFPLLI